MVHLFLADSLSWRMDNLSTKWSKMSNERFLSNNSTLFIEIESSTWIIRYNINQAISCKNHSNQNVLHLSDILTIGCTIFMAIIFACYIAASFNLVFIENKMAIDY